MDVSATKLDNKYINYSIKSYPYTLWSDFAYKTSYFATLQEKMLQIFFALKAMAVSFLCIVFFTQKLLNNQ